MYIKHSLNWKALAEWLDCSVGLDSEKTHLTWSKGYNFPKHRASQGQDGRKRSLRENRILFLWSFRWDCPLLWGVGEDWNPNFCLLWSFLSIKCDLHSVLQSPPLRSPNRSPYPSPGLLPTWPHFQILSPSLTFFQSPRPPYYPSHAPGSTAFPVSALLTYICAWLTLSHHQVSGQMSPFQCRLLWLLETAQCSLHYSAFPFPALFSFTGLITT